MGIQDDGTLFDSYDGADEDEGTVIEYTSIVCARRKATLFDTEDGRVWLPARHITIDEDARTVWVPDWIDIEYEDDFKEL